MIKHFLSLSDLSKADLRAILDDAHAMKAARLGQPKGALDKDPALSGHTLALIFEKSSTRTRFSFDMGIRQLGGSSITATSSDMQLGRGESAADTVRVLSRFVDGIMLRANSHDTLTELATYSDVPIINGLTDYNHPCQIMADLMTLEERAKATHGKDLSEMTLSWIGDGNNVLVSFVNAAAQLGYALRISSPEGYRVNGQTLEAAKAKGANITADLTPAEAAKGADALITDCWVSMGDTDKEERLAAFPPYQIDQKLLKTAAPDAAFLHCLPAYRGQEMTAEVFEGPQSVVWDEAENRMHAQKAVIKWCFGK
ncbi:ornithine carbamoyltransferase [Litorimonas taeanensis]|uniref:Ornithine carbamoyltransferase n=1 Tax=Litorimonas taeanensis TaxID=568099 RepID=A0A420WLC0_9PROT|nr:ornithine carbamoyltransferase [Litorimonas taeanensis]RKQ71841.1 ornithine carbamoyltransferase [Litorimonas taeanensis]